MSNFYFLALSLSENSLESPTLIDWNALDELLKDNLSQGDYAAVQKLLSGQISEGDTGFLAQLNQFERTFLTQTTHFRARRLGRQIPFGTDGENCQTLNDLLEKYYSTPLLLHRKLIEYRLKAFQSGYPLFSLPGILQQVWRLSEIDKWARLDRDRGIVELRRIA